jgi:hypothetical protein
MADTSTGEYTPKETPKVIPMRYKAKRVKKKRSGVRAGSYNKRQRKGYEDMLKEAGKY